MYTICHSRSLQQRLEQLVAVHRQLLRKYAALELDSTEDKKKIKLRDERIVQLEANTRTLAMNMRTQAARHVVELTKLREQVFRLSSLRVVLFRNTADRLLSIAPLNYQVSTVRQEQMDARMEHATQEFSSSSLAGSKGGRAVIRGGSGNEKRSIRGGIANNQSGRI
jgi:hypothetical protein